MSTLSRSLQSLQTEINELLGISTLQTASNPETEMLMRELEKNVADLKGAVYKQLYKAYGGTSQKIAKIEEKEEKSKGFRFPGFGKK